MKSINLFLISAILLTASCKGEAKDAPKPEGDSTGTTGASETGGTTGAEKASDTTGGEKKAEEKAEETVKVEKPKAEKKAG